MFELEYIKDYEELLMNDKTRCDSYVVGNMTMSGDYLRSTLTSDFLKQVLKFTSVNASGLVMFVATMNNCFSDSYDALVSIKQKLRLIKIKDFPNEDVELCAEVILMHSERLECAGAFEDDLLCDILRIFEDSTDQFFKIWAMKEYCECQDFIKCKRLCKTPVRIFTYDSICEEAVNEFHSLVDSSRWELKGIQKSEEPELPKTYKAEIKTAINLALAETTNSRGPNNPNANNGYAEKTCWNCGKKGPIAPNCPEKGLNNSNQSPGNSNAVDTWYLKNADGKDTMVRNDNKYFWCKDCTPHCWRRNKRSHTKGSDHKPKVEATVAEITEPSGSSNNNVSFEDGTKEGAQEGALPKDEDVNMNSPHTQFTFGGLTSQMD